jgi:linoleoyl-CoA desaturase
MLAIYGIPYALIISNQFTSSAANAILWLIMGIGMAGIGLNIMHDANHGSYSRSKTLNHILGLSSNFLGVSDFNWKLQHNVLHHTYTNIEGYDDSLHGGTLLRFSPQQKVLKHHRYQYIYAWPLYTLQTIVWAILTDYVRLNKYHNMGLLKFMKKSYERLMAELVFWKVVYFVTFLVLPMMLNELPWWETSGYFLLMQLSVGFFLTCVFITAHVMPDCDYPLPKKDNEIEVNWFIHQMHTSCNFATGSRWFTWYLGGLNHQTEHHLFPNICHVHYPAVSKILKETASAYQLPYFHHKTFFKAIIEHGKMLRTLGRPEST